MLPYNYGKYKMKIDEKEGVSAFYRDKEGDIYHTYSSYERGIDLMNTTYNFLDLTAKGRDENPDATQDWVRYHDEYKGASKDTQPWDQMDPAIPKYELYPPSP